jgi:BMFP domain-containing protein YqiC
MQKDNSFFDDFSKLASGAAGGLMDLKREISAMIDAQQEKMLRRMNLVTREEFETVRQMAQAAREENTALAARLEMLEKKRV